MHCTPACNLQFMKFLNKPKNKRTVKSSTLTQENHQTSINSCNPLKPFNEYILRGACKEADENIRECIFFLFDELHF